MLLRRIVAADVAFRSLFDPDSGPLKTCSRIRGECRRNASNQQEAARGLRNRSLESSERPLPQLPFDLVALQTWPNTGTEWLRRLYESATGRATEAIAPRRDACAPSDLSHDCWNWAEDEQGPFRTARLWARAGSRGGRTCRGERGGQTCYGTLITRHPTGGYGVTGVAPRRRTAAALVKTHRATDWAETFAPLAACGAAAAEGAASGRAPRAPRRSPRQLPAAPPRAPAHGQPRTLDQGPVRRFGPARGPRARRRARLGAARSGGEPSRAGRRTG